MSKFEISVSRLSGILNLFMFSTQTCKFVSKKNQDFNFHSRATLDCQNAFPRGPGFDTSTCTLFAAFRITMCSLFYGSTSTSAWPGWVLRIRVSTYHMATCDVIWHTTVCLRLLQRIVRRSCTQNSRLCDCPTLQPLARSVTVKCTGRSPCYRL